MTAAPAPPPVPVDDDLERLLPRGGTPVRLDAHLHRVGQLPYRGGPRLLVDSVAAAGLTGRGGAGFPVARKLATVAAAAGRTVAVANGAEGEPLSSKDKVLLLTNPHLVLDGLQLAAEAVGADAAYLYVHPHDEVTAAVDAALLERRRGRVDRLGVEVVAAPDRFLSGEESALAARVSGRPALPTSTPPRVFERGVRGRPTLVQNVETLAHLALVARFGPAWFRRVGDAARPGTMLVTVTGAVRAPGVVEVATGVPIRDVAESAGGVSEPVQSVLVGGYHGAWVPAAAGADLSLTAKSLAPYGAIVGAGVVSLLPASRCGLVETARVARYLADQSAGQCGPCMFGLPAIADDMAELAGRFARRDVRTRLERRCAEVTGRGACHHPDGSIRFIRSALHVFAAELDRHARGGCSATTRSAVLPVPGISAGV